MRLRFLLAYALSRGCWIFAQLCNKVTIRKTMIEITQTTMWAKMGKATPNGCFLLKKESFLMAKWVGMGSYSI